MNEITMPSKAFPRHVHMYLSGTCRIEKYYFYWQEVRPTV